MLETLLASDQLVKKEHRGIPTPWSSFTHTWTSKQGASGEW